MRTLVGLLVGTVATGPLVACATVRYEPLQSGVDPISPASTAQELHGIELRLDLGGRTATLVDGDTKVELRLERVEDREQWIGGCGTMSGHSELEPAYLSPKSFSLRGQSFAFDMVHADCGSGVRMVESDNFDHRWIFGLAPAAPTP